MAVYMVDTCTMHVMYSFYTSKTLNGCLHGAHDGGIRRIRVCILCIRLTRVNRSLHVGVIDTYVYECYVVVFGVRKTV